MGFHQSALVYMVAATAATWTATIVVAVTEVGSNRLHRTLLAASVVIGIGLIAWLCTRTVKEHLLYAVDELHGAVNDIKNHVLHFDRAYGVATRALLGGMRDAEKKTEPDPFELEISRWSTGDTGPFQRPL